MQKETVTTLTFNGDTTENLRVRIWFEHGSCEGIWFNLEFSAIGQKYNEMTCLTPSLETSISCIKRAFAKMLGNYLCSRKDTFDQNALSYIKPIMDEIEDSEKDIDNVVSYISKVAQSK